MNIKKIYLGCLILSSTIFADNYNLRESMLKMSEIPNKITNNESQTSNNESKEQIEKEKDMYLITKIRNPDLNKMFKPLKAKTITGAVFNPSMGETELKLLLADENNCKYLGERSYKFNLGGIKVSNIKLLNNERAIIKLTKQSCLMSNGSFDIKQIEGFVIEKDYNGAIVNIEENQNSVKAILNNNKEIEIIITKYNHLLN